MKAIYIFLSLTILLTLFADDARAQTVLTPIDDSMVSAGNPSNNYGSDELLLSSDYSSSNIRESYLKFDLSEISGSSVKSATLRFTPALARNVSKRVNIASNSNWTEENINWNNKPQLGIEIGQLNGISTSVGSPVDIELNVSQLQQYFGGFFSLAITNTGTNDTFSVQSKENNNPPQLILSVSGETNPTSTPKSGVLTGDANNDGKVDGLDYVVWLTNYNTSTSAGSSKGDFNNSGFVDGLDYVTWLANYGKVVTPTSTPTSTSTPKPGTPTPTTKPATATPTPTQAPSQPTSGIWISPQEIKSLPIAGQSGCANGSLCANAWNALVSRANGSWGAPDLSRYSGLEHSQNTFAGAIVAVRCENTNCANVNASAIRTKVLNALDAVMGTEQDTLSSPVSGQLLAAPRQFPRYVMSAELMGLTDWGNGYKGADNFVAYMADAKFEYSGGGRQTFGEAHNNAASNGNTMIGTARVVSSAYLGRTSDLNNAWLTYRRYVGDTSVGPNLDINDTGRTWFWGNYNNTPHTGINPTGSTCVGSSYPADGAIPADQGRGGACPSNSNTAPGYTQYPWEGLQGIFGQAEVFKRLGYKDPQGKDPYHTMNNALLRAVQYQWYLQDKFGGDWYDSDRAAWVKHLVNYYYGFKPINYDASDGARNIGFTQWTHQ